MSEKRTTKILTGTFRVVFHGEYVPKDDVAGQLYHAIDMGLEDRDDLRSWDFDVSSVTEIDGDPEGYDGPAADGQTG